VNSTVTVSAKVTDDRGVVSGVNLKIGSSSTTIPMTKSGDTYTYNWDTATSADGSYTLTITATDPTGNAATGTTTRTVQVLNSKPNLVVSSVSLSPAVPKIGDTVTVSAVIKNSGTAATNAGTSVVTGFTLDSTALTSPATSTSIAVNGTLTVTSTWTATAGAHTMTVTADKNNAITESSETDNARSQSLTVYKQADANNNGTVDTQDAVILSLNWGKTTGGTFLTGDFNGDGAVETKDAVILSLNWGR
jgi:subtilase family serine protease